MYEAKNYYSDRFERLWSDIPDLHQNNLEEIFTGDLAEKFTYLYEFIFDIWTEIQDDRLRDMFEQDELYHLPKDVFELKLKQAEEVLSELASECDPKT